MGTLAPSLYTLRLHFSKGFTHHLQTPTLGMYWLRLVVYGRECDMGAPKPQNPGQSKASGFAIFALETTNFFSLGLLGL